jgi:hypothetical protein
MAEKSNEEHNRELSKLYFDYFKHLTTINTAAAAAELALSEYLQLSGIAVIAGLGVLVLNLLLSIWGMLLVPTYADTWGRKVPEGNGLLKGLRVGTAVLFFDGVAIFAFYANLDPWVAGPLTVFLLVVTGPFAGLLSRFGAEGYRKPTLLIIFLFTAAMALILYVLFSMLSSTIDLTQALGILTVLFAVVTALVGTYFGIKASSDAREGVQDFASAAKGGEKPGEDKR